MTRAQFKALTDKETARRHQLMFGVRGPDYASNNDALNNFKQRAVAQNRSAVQVCLSDFDKHKQQVFDHFCYGLPSKGQAIVERLDDMQNYIDLLRALMVDEEKK